MSTPDQPNPEEQVLRDRMIASVFALPQGTAPRVRAEATIAMLKLGCEAVYAADGSLAVTGAPGAMVPATLVGDHEAELFIAALELGLHCANTRWEKDVIVDIRRGKLTWLENMFNGAVLLEMGPQACRSVQDDLIKMILQAEHTLELCDPDAYRQRAMTGTVEVVGDDDITIYPMAHEADRYDLSTAATVALLRRIEDGGLTIEDPIEDNTPGDDEDDDEDDDPDGDGEPDAGPGVGDVLSYDQRQAHGLH